MTDILDDINKAMNSRPSEVAGWRGVMHDARAEIVKTRAALTLIASFEGKTLIGGTDPRSEWNLGHQMGAHKAFDQAAEIAKDALPSVTTANREGK